MCDWISDVCSSYPFQRRQVLAKLLYAGLGDDVTLHAAHQQTRDSDMFRGNKQRLGELRRLHAFLVFEKPRIPVPMQAAVIAQAKILHEPGNILGPRSMRVVSRDRIGGRSEEHTSDLQSLMRISYA